MNREKVESLAGWVLAAILGTALVFVVTTSNPDQAEPVNQTQIEEVCVESHFEYRPAYHQGFPSFNDSQINNTIQVEETRNYTDVDGSVYLTISLDEAADEDSKMVYKREKICDRKENQTVTGGSQ